MANKPFTYPCPCDKCKKADTRACIQTKCPDWLPYYYTHQKWINAYAKMIGVPVGKKSPVPEVKYAED